MNSRLHLSPRSPARSPRSARAASRTASAKLAAAFLLLSGLTTGAYADATWTGATSQDWNTITNWSSTPAAPTGALTINTATAGLFPVVSATSTLTPADILIGNGSALNGRIDVTAGSFSTGAGNWLILGRDGGTGTLNVTGGTVGVQDIHIGSTGNTGTGIVNVGGTGVLNAAGAVVLGDGSGNTVAAIGTLNVNAGGIVNSEGDLLLSFAGNSSTVGTVNIATGGTVNVASATKRWLIMSVWDDTHGVLNVNGGALNLNANTDIQFSTGSWDPGASDGPSAINLNSGSITMGAASVINLNNNASRAVNHTINLNGGVFTIGSIVSSRTTGIRALNFNGGTLRAAATQGAFITANSVSVANVKAGGASIDSNGFDITIAKPLTADAVSLGGGLTKLGEGTLTLTGVNTYTGNTAVNGGTLALADNASLKFVIGANGVGTKITGSGTLTLNGDFVLDLSAAGTTVGNSWQLVDAANLTETYGPTFNFGDFGLTSGKWIKQVNGAFYQFDPATGVLSVINNPVVPPPTATAAPSRSSYATGSDIQLGVSASGVGTVTFQWYFQATGAASPTLISGATSATYTVANASAASEGVYSVIVTDSAASGPTTVTFPTFTVLPGTNFTVAYYRFENDATDEIGSNDLATLGSPVFGTTVPAPQISRTGAANTGSVNFNTSGGNGFSAPTDSTLATTSLEDFTIEAFVRFDDLAGWQTIVGRDDDAAPGQGVGDQALFYLSKAGAVVGSGANNGLRIELITKNNVNLQVNSTKVPVVGTWYHVAAVGDATKGTLTLYVDGVAVGTTTGFTGLLVPTTSSDTPWTVGRGDYAAANGDYLHGNIDEVRFSRSALPVSQFLIGSDQGIIVPPPITEAPPSRTLAAGASTTLKLVVTGSANYEWYKDNVLLSGQTGPTITLSGVSAANEGVYRVKAINPLDSAVFSSATATVRVLTLPAAGHRTIGLNFVGAGSGSWSNVVSPIGDSEAAGFYSSVNWNNSATVTNVATQATPLTVKESTGLNPAGANVTWTSANTWAARTETGAPSAKTEHGKLIHGYIESRTTTGASVTLSNIPYASYDVYVYVAGGNGGDRVGSVGINRAGSSTYFFRTLQNDTTQPTVTVEAPYAPFPMIGEATTIETARTAPPATFVRYTGLTGPDLVVSTIDATLNQNAGGLAAIQIVDTTPAGTAYPPTVTAAPVPKLVKGGASASFSVAATPVNSGGVLSYAWTKEGSSTVLGTSATLSLANVAGSATGRYIVTITEASSLGSSSTTRSADLVVVDATRSLLINGDVGTANASTMTYSGVLLPDGSVAAANAGTANANNWNNLATAAGAGSGQLPRESSGLSIPGLSFAYSGVAGSLDDTTGGAIDTTGAPASGAPILRDLAYTDSTTVPLAMQVGGLQAFAGQRFKLVVYAVGVQSTYVALGLNDAASVSLAAANNHLGSAAQQTDNSQGRDLRYTQAFVTFEGVVSPDGVVAWSFGPDVDGGRIPANAFQLLVTSDNLAPPAPTNLVATPGNAQVALTWNASAGASTYTIGRSTVAGGPYSTLNTSSVIATTYTDNTALNGNTYYYVVSAAAANPVLASAYSNQASATLASTATALETWRQANFGSPANSGNGADSADPDNDGLPNLLEYALGTGPNSANASPAVVARSGAFLTLSFSHGADSTLHYHIDSTNDLAAAWTLDEPGQTFSTAGTHLHTDTVSLATQPRRFLRLRVTTP